MPKSMWPLVAVLSVAVGCSGDALSPEPAGELAVQVTPGRVHAERSQTGGIEWLQFRINLEVKNGAEDVVVPHCGTSVQRKEGVEWRTVWTPYCDLALRPPDVLKAGKSRDGQSHIMGVLAGNAGPKWQSASVSGQYRLVYPTFPWSRAEGRMPPNAEAQLHYSNTFEVVDGSE